MKSRPNFLNEKAYFQYFEEKYMNTEFKKRYPLISRRMKLLCSLIKEKIRQASSSNFFQLHAEILGLDAQLQIILLLLDSVNRNSEISEEMVIKYSKEDYPFFMKELCEENSANFLEHTLYFSVI
ncbi:MAG: hypothetical protein H9W82_15870 [Lactobacillus sp.]|nr:hypothetical protein [Lactobacillus sp.]